MKWKDSTLEWPCYGVAKNQEKNPLQPTLLIKAMIEQRVTEEKNEEGLMIIEVAIAIEAGWTELFDKLIVVSVDRDTAIERLQSRNGLSYDDALKRLNAQMTNDERCSKADVIIENSIENSLEQIQLKVQEIFASLSNWTFEILAT